MFIHYAMYLVKTYLKNQKEILIKNNKVSDYFPLTPLDYLEHPRKILALACSNSGRLLM